jgi:hypothetical protein
VRLVAPVAIIAALSACSTKAKLISEGGDCLQATDCADGLVCVPQNDGRRICSNDLSGVQTIEEAAAPPPRDAGPRDGRADAPPADADQRDVDQSDTGGSDAPPD